MPVCSRSRCLYVRQVLLASCGSGRAVRRGRCRHPLAITPPSLSVSGGSGTRWRRSSRADRAGRREKQGEGVSSTAPNRKAAKSRPTLGIRPSDAASASRSRGFAVSSVTRLSRRSMSRMPSSARRNSSRRTISLTCDLDRIEALPSISPVRWTGAASSSAAGACPSASRLRPGSGTA